MVGTMVGTYRLEERLGDGGLEAVDRAVDGASGREAAFRIFAREDRLLTVLASLAPEPIQNQPGDVRAGICAVGVLLYEMLTGRLPFDHTTEFALRQAHLSEPPVAPRAMMPALPEWLDQAVVRALAKSPASRYQNATEFRAVLEAALGLSTSREAAIVRQRDGASQETFSAAPPIPPSSASDAATVALGTDEATAVRRSAIRAASYSRTQRRRLGFIGTSQHLLEVETEGEPLELRLDKDNVEPILAAIEARTGQAVRR